jgi:3-methyladenine DNA glycosylase/8-oxoguanine DNA glycosylase
VTLTETDSKAAIETAVAQVRRIDPLMAAHVDRVGPFQPRPGQGDYFGALARSILYQQLAGKAAAAIHARFVVAVGGQVTPQAVLATPVEALRGAGLSGAKATSIVDLANKVVEGVVPLEGIETHDDEEIIARLSAVRGIGRWTAEMFLLFELGRLDVWPVGDLGVRHGWKLIHGLPEMPSARELQSLGDPYRPYRSMVAWYCWQAVHIARGDMVLPGGA